MVLLGLLFSLSAGVRITLPLLALNLLAAHGVITLPHNLAWLGTTPTLLLLGVAFIVETLVHFVPVVGTSVKAASTPLAFVTGTLLMAVPLDDQTPLVQWTLAGIVGGGLATFTHLGITGARTVSAPANIATGGLLGAVWNVGEIFSAALLALLGYACLHMPWYAGVIMLALVLGIFGFCAIVVVKGWRRLTRLQPV